MSYYCEVCGDKLEMFDIVTNVISLYNGNLKVVSKPLAFCDNKDCDNFAVILAGALTEKPKIKKAKGLTSDAIDLHFKDSKDDK